MARLKILSVDEFNNLYTHPKLEKQDRDLLFELDETDHSYLNSLVDLGTLNTQLTNFSTTILFHKILNRA